MFFNSSRVALVFALCGISTTAAAAPQKRAATSEVTLYAYGNDTNGAAVFYDNGLAYIGNGAPGWSSTASNITFSMDTSDTTVPWTISSNSTPAAFNSTPMLYIVPTSGAFSQVGFAASNASAPTGGVTTGFTLFGTSVAYAANNSDYELSFWAMTTNVTDVWALYWNSDGTSEDDAFPVVLKSTAPTVLAST